MWVGYNWNIFKNTHTHVYECYRHMQESAGIILLVHVKIQGVETRMDDKPYSTESHTLLRKHNRTVSQYIA